MFLHGYLSKKETFIYQINCLKRFFRVIAIDMSGFGNSPAPKWDYSVEDYACEVIALIDELGLKSYNIVAHSFGGRVAVKIALIDKRLKKLVLTGSAGVKPKRKPSYYFKVYSYKLLKKFVSKNKLKNFGSSEYKKLSPIMQKSYLKIVNEHLDSEYEQIKNQTLIIFGDRDKETPLYMAKKINKYIKNSKLIVIKNAGHFAFIDNSALFNAYLLEFLKGGEHVFTD